MTHSLQAQCQATGATGAPAGGQQDHMPGNKRDLLQSLHSLGTQLQQPQSSV